MVMVLGDNGSFFGSVIHTSVSVILHFGVPKGLFSSLTYCHFLHSDIIGGVHIILQAYMCSILTKQSVCRQLLLCVLLLYLIEHINTNI